MGFEPGVLQGSNAGTPTEVNVDEDGDLQIDIKSLPASSVQTTNFTAKGSLVGGTGANTFGELQIGALGNNAVLEQDSAEVTGLKWTKDLNIDGITLADLTASLPVVATAGKTLSSLAYTGGVSFRKNLGLETDDSPTFAGLSLGTGELTAGSINRASGTLTLEIGGTAELSIATGVITVKDGGKLKTDKIEAYDAAGLSLFEDGGKGISIADTTGNIGIVGAPNIATTRIGDGTSAHRNTLVLDSDEPRLIFSTKSTEPNWRLGTAIDTVDTFTWQFGAEDADWTDDSWTTFLTFAKSGYVSIGGAPVGKFTVEGPVYLKEQAEANADVAAYGQIWVDLATPNELYFTDDVGTDTQISSHPMDAPEILYQNGPGQDWIGKKVHKLLGIIQWQTLDGTITEETFVAYNLRRKAAPGHRDLVQYDYTEFLAKRKADWKKNWIKDNTTEVVVDAKDATESYDADIPVEEEVLAVDKDGTETITTEKVVDRIEQEIEVKYELDSTVGSIVPVETVKEVPVYKTKLEQRYKIKDKHRVDEKTGLVYKTVIPTDADAELVMATEFDVGLPKWIKDRLAVK